MNRAFAIGMLSVLLCATAQAVPIIVEAEDTGQISQTGSWGLVSGSVLHDTRGLESSITGSALTFTFTTTGGTFEIFGTTGPNRHEFDISFNGGAATLVDTFSASFLFQQSQFSTVLTAGTYTAHLTVVTPIWAVDYIQYEGSVPGPATLAMFAIGMLLLGASRHHRRVKSPEATRAA